jgi:uncharacterized protein YprB with RNaseH-like and TPR domain
MNLKDRLALLSKQGGALGGEGARAAEFASASTTAERLQRLLDQSTRCEKARRNVDDDAALLLGGSVIAAGVVVVERLFFPDYIHGGEPVATLFEAPLHVLNDGQPVRPWDLLFLDTETTGLAGGTGTLPFVLGLARPEPEGLRLRQYFLTGFTGEAAMLDHARTWLDECSHLVTFNGKCFDVPLLTTRYRLMRLATPLQTKGHLDLLHPTRAAFANRWSDCRLQTAEQRLLGFVRTNDLGGHLIPAVVLGRADEVPRVLEHNRWDLVSLAGLLSRLAAVFSGSGHEDADPRAVARHRLRRGDEAGALLELAMHASSLGVTGLLELAQLYRRRGDWERAVPIWEDLAGQGVAEALERLAKYHEHVRGDIPAALSLTDRLLVRQGARPEHVRRRQRLLGRFTCASTVFSPELGNLPGSLQDDSMVRR